MQSWQLVKRPGLPQWVNTCYIQWGLAPWLTHAGSVSLDRGPNKLLDNENGSSRIYFYSFILQSSLPRTPSAVCFPILPTTTQAHMLKMHCSSVKVNLFLCFHLTAVKQVILHNSFHDCKSTVYFKGLSNLQGFYNTLELNIQFPLPKQCKPKATRWVCGQKTWTWV